MALQVAILGSIEPRVDGEVVGVPAGKQRALSTLLAVGAPQPVSPVRRWRRWLRDIGSR